MIVTTLIDKMILNKKTMGIGFVVGFIILIVITRSWQLAGLFIPVLLFMWLMINLVRKHDKDQKDKVKWK